VLAGRRAGEEIELTSWVLSCRAFSRQIEDHMLDHLFNQDGARAIQLAFRPTVRNQRLRNYLVSLGLDVDGGLAKSLARERFRNHIENLPHPVRLLNLMTNIASRVSQCFPERLS
jgi:predicted enzyme involved in methoxymalonyl-ACP biosynthesis